MEHLIIGGGIAGPITAMALARVGQRATIYEAQPAEREPGGIFLTLAENGLAALRAIGLDDAVRAVAHASPRIAFRSGSGKPLGAMSIGEHTVSIERATLQRVLRDAAAQRGIETRWGKRLVSAARGRASFEDGSHAEGDSVIGCDGIRSRVRSAIDARAPGPRYTGLLNLGGFSRAVPEAEAPVGSYEMIFGRDAFFGWVVVDDPATPIWWFANLPEARELDHRGTTHEHWRERLMAAFAPDRGPARAIVAATASQLACYNTYEMPRVPTWQRDGMIIIGDAAHAASPSSGQGASMAAEDAVALARCLRDGADVDVAFAAFERERRARVERVVAEGRRASSSKTPGPVGRLFRDWLMPRFIAKAADPERSAWLYRHASAL
ncbi:MAG: NAD(P)/FAD-dependent oxidoreductase [Myxococcota bacterium]